MGIKIPLSILSKQNVLPNTKIFGKYENHSKIIVNLISGRILTVLCFFWFLENRVLHKGA